MQDQAQNKNSRRELTAKENKLLEKDRDMLMFADYHPNQMLCIYTLSHPRKVMELLMEVLKHREIDQYELSESDWIFKYTTIEEQPVVEKQEGEDDSENDTNENGAADKDDEDDEQDKLEVEVTVYEVGEL